MTTAIKRALDVLDMLAVADLKSADDATLRRFKELTQDWLDFATEALAAREKKGRG